MPIDRFMIAPMETGLETDVKPWLIPDEAFARLNNAYVFRGRVRRRFGSYLMNTGVANSVAQLYSRARIALTGGAGVGITDGSGNATGTVPGAVFNRGQMFSIGTQLFTVNTLGTPAAMLNTGAGSATYNTTTGAYAFTGVTANTQIYFYPAQPIMGIVNYEDPAINNEPTYVFDTQFSYSYNGTGWERITGEASAGDALWTGTDSQFFWGVTYWGQEAYESILFVTNFNAADGVRYYNGTQWATLNPLIDNVGSTLETCRIIISFKNRLLFLNTIEKIGGTNRSFPFRCRFSWNGSPLDIVAWNVNVEGSGSWVDAPTQEAIITAEILKDRLIVYFERSTWELVYTANELQPFRWQQINTELGAESTFSIVPFDKVILGVGNVGIHACNGANVERIDQKIPEAVFKIRNQSDGVRRVAGIRDYFNELVYWTFPNEGQFTTGQPWIYPNRVLVYNYRTGSWAFNDDSITAFGYYQPQNVRTWANSKMTWAEASFGWNSPTLQSQDLMILAGNQEGFLFIIDSELNRNAPSLQITDITVPGAFNISVTIINHNLTTGDYIAIENVEGPAELNGGIYQVTVVNNNVVTINYPAGISTTYKGSGTAARVSQIDILTKQYNFYIEDGRNAYVSKVDFQVDKTEAGEIAIDCFTSSSTLSLTTSGIATGALLGDNILETSPYSIYPYEQTQERLWHPMYLQADGEFVQLRLYFNDEQMSNPDVVWSDFQLHAMTFYATPTASRMQ